MKRITTHARVKDGKMELSTPEVFRKALRRIEGDGELSFTLYGKPTDRLRRYYFGVVVKMIADYIGEADKETVHELLKGQFNPIVKSIVNKQTGEVSEVRVPGSTRELATDEMSLYVDSCRRWAAEFLGVVIPDPNTTYTE